MHFYSIRQFNVASFNVFYKANVAVVQVICGGSTRCWVSSTAMVMLTRGRITSLTQKSTTI